MADDRKVRITIETKADARGAKEVAKELGNIAVAEKEISREVEAFNELDQAVRKVSPKVEKLARDKDEAAAKTKKYGQAVAQIGPQLQDFAVQVGSGGDALTALAQQGSQLLSVFGPGGVLAGTLLAVGAAVVGFATASKDGSDKAKGSVEDLAAALEDVREKGVALSQAQIDFSLQAIKDAKTEAENLRDAYKDSLTAQNESAKAQLSNLAILMVSLQELDRLEGAKLDRLKETQKIAEVERQQRELAAQQQKAAATKELDDAKEKLRIEQEDLDKAKEQSTLNVKNIDYLSQQIAKLKERKKLLEETAAEVIFDSSGFDGPGVPSMAPTAAADKAKAELGRTDFGARIAYLEGLIKGIQADDATMKAVEEATVNVAAAQTRVNDLAVAVPIKIAEIDQTLATANIAAKVEDLAANNKALVDETNAQVASLQNLTPQQKKIADDIKATTADQAITTQEASANVARLLTLQGTLKTSQQTQTTNLDSLIDLTRQVLIEQNRQKVEIDGLKQKAGIPIK